jgi:hypothetical protein
VTIAKGVQWGRPCSLEIGRPVATSDAELAELVRRQVLDGPKPNPGRFEGATAVGLAGGDLFVTLGGAAGGRSPCGPDAWLFPLDAMVVRCDSDRAAGGAMAAVAHVVALRHPARSRGGELRHMGWFEAETLVVANAAFLGDWNIAPRGHPNDGRLEVTRGSLPRRDRRRLGARLRTGTHLPHPDLATSRPKSVDSAGGPWRLFVDGVDHGMVDRFTVSVVPDAFAVVM